MSKNELTKKDIIANTLTSRLPACGTEELNKFYQDTCVVFDAFWAQPDGSQVGCVYRNLTKALKAYERYGFSDADIAKIRPHHEDIKANSIAVKNSPDDHAFIGFRNEVPFGKKTVTVMK